MNSYSKEETSRLVKVSMNLGKLKQSFPYSSLNSENGKNYIGEVNDWRLKTEVYLEVAKEFNYIPEIKNSVKELKELYSLL